MLFSAYPTEGEIEEKVCLVCAPTLAKELFEKHNVKVTLCDVDTRFDWLPGFKLWNLKEPY